MSSVLARRTLLRALMGGAAAAPIQGVLGKVGDALDTTSPNVSTGSTIKYTTPFDQFFKRAENYSNALQDYRNMRRLDPDIACLRSVSEATRMRMQVERLAGERSWFDKLQQRFWR